MRIGAGMFFADHSDRLVVGSPRSGFSSLDVDYGPKSIEWRLARRLRRFGRISTSMRFACAVFLCLCFCFCLCL